VGKGAGARTMKLAVKPFTMVGATTRSGLLSAPLRDRFGQHYHLDFYSHDELAQIIQRSAQLLEVRIDQVGAAELAARARHATDCQSSAAAGARFCRSECSADGNP
jgi:holliday junction DNA helicase RuvB